jgi:hypothetical protein
MGFATGGVPILMDTENTGENFALFLVGLALFGMGMGLRQWSEKIAAKAIASGNKGSFQEYRP